jgi:hypothetical protein
MTISSMNSSLNASGAAAADGVRLVEPAPLLEVLPRLAL